MADDPTALEDCEWDEVSLVGIPANQHAHVVLFKSHTVDPEVMRHSSAGTIALAQYELSKRDFSAAQRKKMADEGIAMPDGSYPIPDIASLKAAIKLRRHGNSSNASVWRHICRRAKALGREDLVEDVEKSVDKLSNFDRR